MKLSTLKYLFKEGIVGLWKNRVMALASAGTIVLCLLILGMSYSIVTNVDYMLKQLEIKFGITAYVKEGILGNEILQLKSQVENIPYVAEVNYISKEDALKSFSEGSKDDSIFNDFVQDNPLPASFEINVTDIEYQSQVVQALSSIAELEVRYLQKETAMFMKINNTINTISLIIIGCLIVVGLLLMTNTIKLTVYIRRKEINIMKYIGATDWFIRLPFLIEGLVIGAIGALLSIIIIILSYSWLSEMLITNLMGMLNGLTLKETSDIMRALIPICMSIGTGIGFVGSGMAIHKHLKV
ncbi:permease-like cell division protein FtsX [Cellulosilyticum sp. I15G10I2]|uniref:permease-like cell division protein FtsX n=1 Tax=Cellulosilyticum sp. I15G10I2 TaxID=1892843 RepID=UPI000B1FBA34|nr:permease-like cell division protein FtsX [Cellulosilyticum sp. I15G10I2]